MSPFKFGFMQGRILPSPTSVLENNVELGEPLGKGHFGSVRACKDKRTGERLACKTISKSKLKCWEEREDVRREVEIMESLGSHPNIVSLRATFEDDDSVHLILDYCEGGELFDEISVRGPLSERRAAQVMHGLARAVSHCHSMGVFHRDLKPENILLVHKNGEQRRHLEVKLADFGLSLRLKEGQTVSGLAGSPYYLAPEVLSGGYGQQADIWSMGVVLYMMLSETAPFYGETEKEICESISKAQLQFNGSVWERISPEAKDLIKWTLRKDPSERPSAKAILQHPWVAEHTRDVGEGTSIIHRSSSSTPVRVGCSAEPISSPSTVAMHPCQSLPRGSPQTRDLLTWLSPQLAGANPDQGLTSVTLEGTPLLEKFNEVLADLEDGIHYFVLEEAKGPYDECSEGEVILQPVKEQGDLKEFCRQSQGVKAKSYEPTPADALDWIFGL